MVAVGTIKLCRALTASGMPMECPPPSTSAGAGLGDAGDQLCQRKAGLHIAAHRVQQHQKPLDAGVLLHRHQLGNDVLIFGGLLPLRRFGMPFDLADDGQAVDDMTAPAQGDRARSSISSFSIRCCSAGVSFAVSMRVLLP